jgi:sialate O-acetylesterase
MVLQRDQPIPVWGWADPGEKITIQLLDDKQTVTADEFGQWQVRLKSLPAGGPHEMVIQGKERLVFKEVLIGEVWLCSGQSNMQWSMKQTSHGGDIPNAKHPNIRLISIPLIAEGVPQTDFNGEWLVCTPDNVTNFSAVAYFYGKKLHEELNVPVGLINSSWGGTAIEPWTPLSGFNAVPSLKSFADLIQNADETYQKQLPESLKRLSSWADQVGKMPYGKWPPRPELAKHPLVGTSPGCIYNAMIHPLIPYGIRGAIWYQGESNNGQGMEYCDKMKALVQGWRKNWGQGDFPFYYVQVAPFSGYADGNIEGIWEAQAAALQIPNTGMVVTTDLVNNINDIHPGNKRDVGDRLALWALAKTYQKSVPFFSGPLFKQVKREQGKFVIEFEHADGLKTRDGKEPNSFEVGTLEKFVPARAEIRDQKLVVWSDELPEAEFVRFGWNKRTNPNLVNGGGLPASPFRNYSDAVKLVGRSIFADSQKIQVNRLGNSGEIRYTLDGSIPRVDSPLLADELEIKKTAKIRARLFQPDGRSGLIAEAEFTKVEPLEYRGRKFVPGLRYDYFEAPTDLSRIPDLTALTRNKTGIVDEFKFDFGRPAGNYAVRFRGLVKIPKSDAYTFVLASDDGSRLRINGKQIVESDGIHPAIEKAADPLVLEAGLHEIEIDFFQGGGNIELKLLYSSKDLPKQPVPFSALFCAPQE